MIGRIHQEIPRHLEHIRHLVRMRRQGRQVLDPADHWRHLKSGHRLIGITKPQHLNDGGRQADLLHRLAQRSLNRRLACIHPPARKRDLSRVVGKSIRPARQQDTGPLWPRDHRDQDGGGPKRQRLAARQVGVEIIIGATRTRVGAPVDHRIKPLRQPRFQGRQRHARGPRSNTSPPDFRTSRSPSTSPISTNS